MNRKEKEKIVIDAMLYWQEKLQLQNWKIGYEFVEETNTKSVYGDIVIVWDVEQAIIEICNKCPDDILESLIVHEMLHIYTHTNNIFISEILTQLCKPKIKAIMMSELLLKENIMVDKIARILVNLRKEKE